MNEELLFELVPEEVPRQQKKGSKYDPMIDQFVQSEIKSARVFVKGINAKELAIGLRGRVRSRDLMETIKVSQRRDKVYLIKK